MLRNLPLSQFNDDIVPTKRVDIYNLELIDNSTYNKTVLESHQNSKESQNLQDTEDMSFLLTTKASTLSQNAFMQQETINHVSHERKQKEPSNFTVTENKEKIVISNYTSKHDLENPTTLKSSRTEFDEKNENDITILKSRGPRDPEIQQSTIKINTISKTDVTNEKTTRSHVKLPNGDEHHDYVHLNNLIKNEPPPLLNVPYMGLKKPPTTPNPLTTFTTKKTFVQNVNIPKEMKTLPMEGFILQTVLSTKPSSKSKRIPSDFSVKPPTPNFVQPVQKKKSMTSNRPRDINMDRFREFVYKIRHSPKLDVPKESLYKMEKNSTENVIVVNTTTVNVTAAMLPKQGRREGVPQLTFMNVKTVFTRYWPAVLGITVGTIFLLTGLVTSLLCKQHR